MAANGTAGGTCNSNDTVCVMNALEYIPSSYAFIGTHVKERLRACKNESYDPHTYFQKIVEEYENKSKYYYLPGVPDGDKIGLMVALSIIGACGGILNFIQLVYIINRIRSKKKLAMDYVLISLSVADFYNSTASSSVAVFLWGNEFDWKGLGRHSNSLCKLTTLGTVVTRGVALYCMCIIAVTRLIAIRWPLILAKVKVKSHVRNLLEFVFTWINALFICIPTGIFANTDVWALKPNTTLLEQDPGHYYPVYSDDPSSCADYARLCTVSKHGGNGALLENIFWWLNIALYLALPQLVLSFSYTMITITLLKRRRMRKITFSSADPTFTAITDKQDREAITSSILGGVYVALNLPYLLYSVFDPLPHDSVKGYDRTRSVLGVISALTVITNPCIYTFFTPAFIRQEKHCCSQLCYSFTVNKRAGSKSDANGSSKETSTGL